MLRVAALTSSKWFFMDLYMLFHGPIPVVRPSFVALPSAVVAFANDCHDAFRTPEATDLHLPPSHTRICTAHDLENTKFQPRANTNLN